VKLFYRVLRIQGLNRADGCKTMSAFVQMNKKIDDTYLNREFFSMSIP
jgi:hypothetical protein